MNDAVFGPVFIVAVLWTGGYSETEGFRTAYKAAYKQTGLEKMARETEKRYVPKDLRLYGGWTMAVVKAVTEQRITFEITF